MKKWLIIALSLIHLSAHAKDNLEPTIVDGTLAFPVTSIPERASVVVYCTFDMPGIQSQEFYAYVTPYAGRFSNIQTSQAFHGDVSIGSKVYMLTNSKTLKISIVGVTRSNEAILIDLNRMPASTTVQCEF